MNQYKVCVSVKKTKNTLSNTISLKKMFLVLMALNSAFVCMTDHSCKGLDSCIIMYICIMIKVNNVYMHYACDECRCILQDMCTYMTRTHYVVFHREVV